MALSGGVPVTIGPKEQRTLYEARRRLGEFGVQTQFTARGDALKGEMTFRGEQVLRNPAGGPGIERIRFTVLSDGSFRIDDPPQLADLGGLPPARQLASVEAMSTAIRQAMDRLDGLRVAFMGDLRYGRTVHSLAKTLLHFDVELHFVGPSTLRLPEELRDAVESAGKLGREVESLDDLPAADVLYVTRIQQERFPDPLDYERVRHAYRIDKASVARLGEDLKILHPLPRVTEVDPDLDTHPGALYFRQTLNGVTVRMALLDLILGGGGPP